MDTDIKGNPGTGNTFTENRIGNVVSMNPSAKTVINHIQYGNGLHRAALITQIINCLSDCERMQAELAVPDAVLFNIQPKIAFNSLERWRGTIRTYASSATVVDGIYSEFDAQGRNRSTKVLRWLNREYKRLSESFEADVLFDELKKNVYDYVNSDPTCNKDLMMEELDECVCIVLVDAFMKCQIFEKPDSDRLC